ncbi:MAG TPA: ATP-binding protein [Chloroflexota bacterium]|nr:ATP-binding protein [Chloroflexota bacterium]
MTPARAARGAQGPGRRLRTQLLLSFAAVAFVALAAAGSTVVWLMLGYRTQALEQRLRDAAGSAGAAAAAMERQGADPESVAAGVAAQVPFPAAQVLVLDAGGAVLAQQAVSESTSTSTPTTRPASFAGLRIQVPAIQPPADSGPPGALPGPEPVVIWTGNGVTAGPQGYLLVACPFPRAPRPGSQPALSPPQAGQAGQALSNERPAGPPGLLEPRPEARTLRLVLAIPQHSLPSAWAELAPGLAAAGALALLAAAAVAWWLAASITRPVQAVTQAARRLARGQPHQPVPERGAEEIAQLARSFNTMAHEVEQSDRTLRDFVADASHELRTPLTTIHGFSQAVVEGVLPAPPDTQDAVRHIHREADRMRSLVEDLLLLSKVESHQPPGAASAVDLAELLDTIAQRLQPVVRQREQQMVLHLPQTLLTTGDASQLERLFGNLIDNAAKYAPAGGTITVRATLEPGPAPRITVSVHNTGSHIPPAALPHIFERFFRVDKSRAREVAGSGLGLAIAREVALRHGGSIQALSDPQTGTTFVVTLPATSLTALQRNDRCLTTASPTPGAPDGVPS